MRWFIKGNLKNKYYRTKEVKALKRRLFRAYGSGEAGRVVTHGLRQITRNRRPSMAFRNVRDPREALKFAALAWSIEAKLEITRNRTLRRKLMYVEPGVYQIDGHIGSRINDVLAAVKELATSYRTGEVRVRGVTLQCGNPLTLEVRFNGVIVRVRHDSDLELLYRDWRRGLSGYIKGVVGPYPNPQLSEAELESDRQIKARKDEEYRLYQEELRRKQEAAKAAFDAKLAAAPPMEVSDQEVWNGYKRENDDSNGGPMGAGYGARIISYAEDWARLMQAEMAAGKELADIMSETSYEANYDGITGAMHGAAAHVLAECWLHGEQLRRLHNLKYQLGTEGERANEEGGTINPAIISIG